MLLLGPASETVGSSGVSVAAGPTCLRLVFICSDADIDESWFPRAAAAVGSRFRNG